MKPLILTTALLATPAFAGGIAEPKFAPDTMPAHKFARMVEQDGGGLFKAPTKQVRPDTPDDPDPVTEKPRMDKTTALASRGLGRGDWRGLPADLQEVAKGIYRKEVRTGQPQDWSAIAKGGEL